MNLLVIRFSSFGDIVQAMAVLRPWKERYPKAKITWVTKESFGELVKMSPYVDRVITLGKKVQTDCCRSLFEISTILKQEDFDFVYDAHNVLRSRWLLFLFALHGVRGKRLTRSKNRLKRFLLFYFRKNLFTWPFRGMKSYLEPLELPENLPIKQDWNFPISIKEKFSSYQLSNAIVFCPSAAWQMKRWPVGHWQELVKKTSLPIYLLGGPEDQFCEEIRAVAPEKVTNLAGKLSLVESCYLISQVKYTVSADTGLIHVADLLGKKGSVLIGPTAFGFTTSPAISLLQVELPCRPCSKDGRGKCSRSIYQECMVKITPEKVSQALEEALH